MARIKQTARKYGKGIITWTRFHLPLDQEWPTWSATYEDVHVGPLAGVAGVAGKVLLGRMVETPEQAAYIIGECHRHRKVSDCIFSDRLVVN